MVATIDGNGVPLPIQSSAAIGRFRTTWSVSRADDETGLSIVVPYVDEDFTADDLVRAVAEDYYIAVLTGELEAVVESGEADTVEINRDTLRAIISAIPDSNRSEELRAKALLVQSALELHPDEDYVRVAPQEGQPSWSPELIPLEDRQRAKSRLDNNEVVAVRVPVRVGPKDGTTASEWYFDVFYRLDRSPR